MKRSPLFSILILAVACTAPLSATPSTQIWNPSTDIRAAGAWHLDIDNYFSVVDNDKRPFATPACAGFEYGLFRNFELGFDLAEPTAAPLIFNAKYGLPEGDMTPAFAAGIQGVGTKKTGHLAPGTDANIAYALAAKTFNPVGRLTLGCYYGNDRLLVDENGIRQNTGIIATWDRQVTDKVWLAVDYASGRSYYGALCVGGSYAFAPGTSVILGYVIYNNGTVNPNNQATTQLDINF